VTPSEIPPIVLLVDSDREALDEYSRHLENGGMWVAGTTAYDELIASAEELHPDVIIADADRHEGDGLPQALDAVRHHPDLAATPLVVLVPGRAQTTPEADIALRKPVPPEFLLRRTWELLGRTRELRGRSNAIATPPRPLRDRAERLVGQSTAIAAGIDETRRACPKCSTHLDWVERGTLGRVTYDYYRWCPRGCGLYCFNRDRRSWLRIA
jgi:CheY-like chemotaxis protein